MKFSIKGLSSDFYSDFSLNGESGKFYNIVYKKSLEDRDLAKYLSLIKKDKKFSFTIDDKDIAGCDLGNSPVMYLGDLNPFCLCYKTSFLEMTNHILSNYTFTDGTTSKKRKDRWLISRLLKSIKKNKIFDEYSQKLINDALCYLKSTPLSVRKKKLKIIDVMNLVVNARSMCDIKNYFNYDCALLVKTSIEMLLILGVLMGKKIIVLDNINRIPASRNTRSFWRIYNLIEKYPNFFKGVSFINIVENLTFAYSKGITYTLNNDKFVLETGIDFNEKFNKEITIFFPYCNKYFSMETFGLELNKINSIYCSNNKMKNNLFKGFCGSYNNEVASLVFPIKYKFYDDDDEYLIIMSKKARFATAIFPQLYELGLIYGKDINFNLEQFYLHHCSERDNYSDLIKIDSLVEEYRNDIEFLNQNSEKVHKAYIAHKNDVINYLNRYDVEDSLSYSSKISYDQSDNYQSNYDKVKKLFKKDELTKNIIDLDEVTRLKVRIAQQIMIGSKLFVFDDVFSHFDSTVQEKIYNEIFKIILENDGTILYITDKMTDILKQSEKVYFMKDNNVIRVGKFNKN